MFSKKIYWALLATYTILGILATLQDSSWLIDTVVTISIMLALLALRKPLKLTNTHFILANIIIIAHNAGFFGLYAKTFIIGYDTYMHFFSTIMISIIIYDLLKRHLTASDALLITATIAMTVTLALFIELIEYAGYTLIGVSGPSVGLAGAGAQAGKEYADTIKDIAVNMLGASIGAIGRYLHTKDA